MDTSRITEARSNIMSIKMSKSDAIKWLIEHLEPELKAGGCHSYQNGYFCKECEAKNKTLEQIQRILGISQKNIIKWDATARITE